MNAPTQLSSLQQRGSAAPAKPQTINDLSQFLAKRMTQIKSVVAKHLTPEKLARIAMNELRTNASLAKAALQNPESFVNSILQAAHLGLEIGGPLGQAYLVPYKGEVKMMTGYRGLISLARRSGEISSINAEIVFEKDEFDLTLGIEAKVTHKPNLDGDRGAPKLTYMVAHFKDGGYHFEWMSIAEVMKLKDRSSSVQSAKKFGGKTPWDTDEGEMIKKTVIRRGWKYLPMSIEMQNATAIDEATDAGKSVVIEGDSVLVADPETGEIPETRTIEHQQAETIPQPTPASKQREKAPVAQEAPAQDDGFGGMD